MSPKSINGHVLTISTHRECLSMAREYLMNNAIDLHFRASVHVFKKTGQPFDGREMQIIIHIIKNMALTLLTIAALVGFAWLMLLALHWGLKLKSGSREQDGLVDLWQEAMTKRPPNENKDESANQS